jgi:hypothetical protein
MGRFVVRDARREEAKLRLFVDSPSGGGKTYGALLLAKGLGGKIVVIDTERKSSMKYQGRPELPEFRVIEFDPPYSPESYIEAIDAAEADGAEVVIIDSTSHEWEGPGGCLELVDDIARAKFRGNTWSAWSELTPRHRRFIDRMLSSKCHIIATARAKTETSQVEDGGRKKVVKLGMKSIARDGTEFEFDVVLNIVHDGHFAVASKDRTGIFTGDPKPITEETGRQLLAWLNTGDQPPARPLEGSPSRERDPEPAAKIERPRPGRSTHAAAPSGGELRAKVIASIQKAKTVADLGAVGDLLEVRVSEGRISEEEHAEFLGLMNARHQEIEPEVAADA